MAIAENGLGSSVPLEFSPDAKLPIRSPALLVLNFFGLMSWRN
tara:strand:- start:303 stop:431 length:129 start_codon:yes stop_codon:yes gene_type:complete